MKCWKWLLCALILCALMGCGAKTEELDVQHIRQDTVFLCEEFGSRVTGTQQEKDACDWLEKQLEGMGFSAAEDTLRRKAFQGLKGLRSENLIARYNTGEDTPIYCVVAHYDSISSSPGARDNACAVGILLEITRALTEKQPELTGEIRLVFLGSEENGYHGSRAYLEGLAPQELERHKAVFNMDISAATAGEGQLVCCTLGGEKDGGYLSGDFLEPAENAVTRSIAQVCEMLYDQDVPVVHGGESDHVTFHQWEIDCANVCWRRVEDGLTVLPPEYHGTDDVPQTIDYETARMTGTCILEAVCRLAQ